jgi:hypothetical protein
MKTNIHFWSYFAQLFLEWEMFQIKFIEKIKTHILCWITFPLKSCCLCYNVEKCCTVGEAADSQYDTVHAHCMLYT